MKHSNYIRIFKLITKFGQFRAEHISCFGTKGHGIINHLSSTRFYNLIELNASTICKKMHAGKYFSVCIDSKSDVSQIDQLTCTICK